MYLCLKRSDRNSSSILFVSCYFLEIKLLRDRNCVWSPVFTRSDVNALETQSPITVYNIGETISVSTLFCIILLNTWYFDKIMKSLLHFKSNGMRFITMFANAPIHSVNLQELQIIVSARM